MARKPAVHKAVHKTVHKTTHQTVHKTVHKTTTHKPKAAKKTTTRKVGLFTPDAVLLNDRANTCALAAWWNACTSAYGDLVPTPTDNHVAWMYGLLGGDGDEGLYLEAVLDQASNGLFGYRLNGLSLDGVLIGSNKSHAMGGFDAEGVILDNFWLLDIEPI